MICRLIAAKTKHWLSAKGIITRLLRPPAHNVRGAGEHEVQVMPPPLGRWRRYMGARSGGTADRLGWPAGAGRHRRAVRGTVLSPVGATDRPAPGHPRAIRTPECRQIAAAKPDLRSCRAAWKSLSARGVAAIAQAFGQLFRELRVAEIDLPS